MTLVAQGFAHIGGTAVLPDNRIADRLPASAVPDDGCLALIGDADGGRWLISLRQDFACRGQDRRPNYLGIMLNPAICWIQLGELLVGNMQRLAFAIKDDCAGTGGTLINSKNRGYRGHNRILLEGCRNLSYRIGRPDCYHVVVVSWPELLGIGKIVSRHWLNRVD